MRRTLIFLTAIVVIASCTNQETKTEEPRFSQPQAIDSIALFLGLFPGINPEDLHVYTPGDTISNDKFEGRQIAPSFYKYLKFDNNIEPLAADTLNHFFACYQFKLTDKKIGLIIRRPSQYSESAIDLYTWDNAQKKIIDSTNLTDAFGDEGWYFVQDAWLKDINNDKNIDIITRRKDFEQDLDDTAKISQSDSLFVYLGNGFTFKKKNIIVDTSKFQLKYWSDK